MGNTLYQIFPPKIKKMPKTNIDCLFINVQ